MEPKQIGLELFSEIITEWLNIIGIFLYPIKEDIADSINCKWKKLDDEKHNFIIRKETFPNVDNKIICRYYNVSIGTYLNYSYTYYTYLLLYPLYLNVICLNISFYNLLFLCKYLKCKILCNLLRVDGKNKRSKKFQDSKN